MAHLSTSDSSGKSPPEPFSLGGKVAFGMGDMGAGLTANLIAFSFLIFLTSAAGMRPGVAGLVLAVGKVWDAVNDPIVGYLSDRTETRWGRRYPWIVAGAIPFGITFFLMWIVPGISSQTGLFWYYVLISVAFQVFYTMVNLPYTTLTAELTKDYDERTELTAFRLGSSLFGAILALALGLVVSQLIADVRQQYLVLGALCSVVSVLPLIWCVLGTYPYAKQRGALGPATNPDAAQSLTFFPAVEDCLHQSRLSVCSGNLSLCLAGVAGDCQHHPLLHDFLDGVRFLLPGCPAGAGNGHLYDVFCQPDQPSPGQAGNVLHRHRHLDYCPTGPVFLCNQDKPLSSISSALLLAFGVATAYVVPWAMLPDVIELDELQTGQRREGVFYAFMTLLQKVGLAGGLFLVGVALEYSGFVSEAPQQPDSALLAIRTFIGPVPMVLLICAVILAKFYPITRQMHEEILLRPVRAGQSGRE